MIVVRLGLLFSLIVAYLAAQKSYAQSASLMAGAAVCEITPTEPVPMWGYGSRHASLSQGTLDPLKATTVVLQVGQERVAIVGLDLGRSPSEESLQRIRVRIQQEAGVNHSLIAGSHTHHGPVLELSDRPRHGQGTFDAALRYYSQLEDAIVNSIVQATKELTAAKIATAAVELEGFNRNRHSKIGVAPIDRRLAVLKLDSVDSGKTIATILNFAAHPTSLPDDKLEFSADYVGSLRHEIETAVGGVAVFMQGASGDLSTNRGPHGDHEQFGRALGKQATQLLTQLETKPATKPSLKVREERFTFESRVDLSNPLIRGIYSAAFFPELIANFVDEYAEGVRPRATVVLLNEQIALVGVSGEFFCQHAIRLRERARVEQLFFFGYCNGYHQYFPTIEAAAEGGYGADNQVAPAAVGAGEQIMNSALEWIYRMQGAKL
jgi:neutral ceramidase